MKVTVSALVAACLLGSGFAQQCCDFKNVTGATDASLNGQYKLKTNQDSKPNPDCKDGCIYEKDEESYCFKAIPIAEAPSVDCEKKSPNELAGELDEVNNVENLLGDIDSLLGGDDGTFRGKRAVTEPATCDEVLTAVTALKAAMEKKDYVKAKDYAVAVKAALITLNGCKEKRAELKASVKSAKKVVQERKVMIHKQLVQANVEAVAAGSSTARVPTTLPALTTTPKTVMTKAPMM